jgi:hypothetical protein
VAATGGVGTPWPEIPHCDRNDIDISDTIVVTPALTQTPYPGIGQQWQEFATGCKVEHCFWATKLELCRCLLFGVQQKEMALATITQGTSIMLHRLKEN